MGLFSKSEVVILKESSDAKQYLAKLEELLLRAQGDIKEKIEKEISITKAGVFGEDTILFELRNSGMDMVILHDIYLETKDGLGAQIDYIVVTPKVNFVIECKNLFGNIEIDSKGNFIRTIEYKGRKIKEGIYSPITQNERHLMVMKECRTEGKNLILAAAIRKNFESFNKSLVVLANPKTVVNDRYAKKEIKNQVLRADQLIAVMKQKIAESRELPSSKKDMMQIAENYLAMNKDERKDYLVKYNELVEAASSAPVSPEDVAPVNVDKPLEKNADLICPKCGAKLVLRTAKKGDNIGQQFYGCSGFPKCRYILKQ